MSNIGAVYTSPAVLQSNAGEGKLQLRLRLLVELHVRVVEGGNQQVHQENGGHNQVHNEEKRHCQRGPRVLKVVGKLSVQFLLVEPAQRGASLRAMGGHEIGVYIGACVQRVVEVTWASRTCRTWRKSG